MLHCPQVAPRLAGFLDLCRFAIPGLMMSGAPASALRAGPEIHPAARRKLLLLADHAGGDAIDIRNLGAAKPKRIVAAGLLLLRRISLACGRQHRNRKRGREQQTELKPCRLRDSHDSPRAIDGTNCAGLTGDWQAADHAHGPASIAASIAISRTLEAREMIPTVQATAFGLPIASGLAHNRRLRMASSTSARACRASRASASAACARNSTAVS